MTSSRTRPLLAFWFLALAAAVIMAQGLRADVARVLVGAGVPDSIANVISPDMVLGHQLTHRTARPTAAPASPFRAPTTRSAPTRNPLVPGTQSPTGATRPASSPRPASAPAPAPSHSSTGSSSGAGAASPSTSTTTQGGAKGKAHAAAPRSGKRTTKLKAGTSRASSRRAGGHGRLR